MDINEITEKAKKELSCLTKLECSSVTGVTKDEKGWHVGVELIEKKSIPDSMDLLATYEITLSDEGEVIEFVRGKIRKRGDTGEEE